ncbi:MAG: NAD(P)H-hydrate dehydratase [Caldisericia bacterium]|nr:NAD(P)H-hydrate dehydratase [Caldisericia bacterium]MDD4614141.1 NAD(P)H-hydrate dehydratase [Caldisericia bacterium]
MYVHTGQDTYATDKMMEDEFLVSPMQLMEVAGKNVADQILKYTNPTVRTALIAIGPGNNGGDGMVVARFLVSQGWSILVVPALPLDTSTGPAKKNYQILQKICQNPIFHSQILGPYSICSLTEEVVRSYLQKNTTCIIVDALFGVGLKRPITGKTAELIQILNSAGRPIISIDMPSGISSETGSIVGAFHTSAIKADFTVTFEAPKIGHLLYPGKQYTGTLLVTKIGILHPALEKQSPYTTILDEHQLTTFIKPRPNHSHKGLFGRVYCICGSSPYKGALTFSLLGAMHAGAGLITACYKETNELLLSSSVIPEATHFLIPVKNDHYTTHSYAHFVHHVHPSSIVCIGSGLGREMDIQEFCRHLYLQLPNPMVLDADALWAIRNHLSDTRCGPRIVTPHLGEMSYLTNTSVDDIQKNLVEIAIEYAKKWQMIVVLKSSTTVVADPTGSCYINNYSSSALAQGGAGDVLAGTIAGFMAQRYSSYHACILSVALHSLAAIEMEQDLTSWASSTSTLPTYYGTLLHRIVNT